MSEATEQQSASTEQQVSNAAPTQEPSLEDVFSEYKVEHTTPQEQQYVRPQEQQQRQQPEQRQPELHVPDPALDPTGFQRYEAANAQERQALRQALHGLHGEVSAFKQERVKAKEEADIKKAVGFLKEKVPDADDEMLEVYLGAQARKDERVMSVWNNRDKNPKAWNAALKAIANTAAGKFQMTSDPQLAENVRAMKTSQQGMATAQKQPSKEEAMGALQGAEFDQAWERLRRN